MSELLKKLQEKAEQAHEHHEQEARVSVESLFDNITMSEVSGTNFTGFASPLRVKAALEGLVYGEPEQRFVEEDEFHRHVEEDMREHQELREDVDELQKVVGVVSKGESLVNSVAQAGSEQPAAAQIAVHPLSMMAKEINVPAPQATMEDMMSWVTKLKRFVQNAVNQYTSELKNGAIRPISSYRVLVSHLERTRKLADKLDSTATFVVELDNSLVKYLGIGRAVPELAPAMAKYTDAVCAVHKSGAVNYAVMVEGLRQLPLLAKAEDDTQFENVLKEVVKTIPFPECVYDAEAGKETYLGGVRFVPTSFQPIKTYPAWFSPALEMDNSPYYEVDRTRLSVSSHRLTLTGVEVLQLLDAVEACIAQLGKCDEEWSKLMREAHEVARKAIDQLASDMAGVDVEKFSMINKRMMDILCQNALMMPVVLAMPTQVMLSRLLESLYSTVNVALMACRQRHA